MRIVVAFTLFVFIAASGCASAPGHGTFNVLAFAAAPDGKTNTTRQLQSAINAAARAGGGTVTVPAGGYVTGTLWLKSNVTLHLDAGATLLGSQNQEDFPMWASDWEGAKVPPRRAPLIAGENLDNVALTGRGAIDARGAVWWKLQRDNKHVEVLRPLLFRVVNSRNVLVEGLTFRNSPMWTITPLACDNVTIDRITIVNPPDSPNTDGINPDSCKNVHISNCHIDVGDDCITLKSGKETDNRRALRPCENITISNCTLLHGHGGVVFGSEMSGSVRNVAISNCVFIGTDRGLRFKARRGRGGVVEDVRADNIIMDGVLCPFTINLFYAPGAPSEKQITDESAAPVDDSTPRFRRLRFSNITARNVKHAAAYIVGLPEMHVEDVAFDNVSFYLDAASTKAGQPDMAVGAEKLSRAGFIATRVDKLTLRNVEISDQNGPAVRISDARDLLLSGVIVRTPPKDAQSIQLTNVTRWSDR